MRLSEVLKKVIITNLIVLCFSVSHAYDYPVVGEFNTFYKNVFTAIDDGRCDSMSDELKELADKEGVSANIYLAICYFKKMESDKAFATLDSMLVNQEYDEALYTVQTEIDKGNSDSRLLKYRGLAYFNIGALNKSLADLEAYLADNTDDDALFTIVDIYVNLKDYDKAAESIEKASVKDGRYFFRKGNIALRTGKSVTALRNLRKVMPEEEVYADATILIGDICTGTKRYICAEKQYEMAAAIEGKEESAKKKLEKMEDRKKRFNGFLSVGGQYDSNVTSIDEDEIADTSEVESFRLYAVADVKVNFYPSFADTVSVGTMHYVTSNENLHSYDMSTHKVYVMMKQAYDSFEIMLPKLSTAVTYFGDEKYSTAVTAEASGKYKLDTWTFGIPLKVTKSNYMDDEETGAASKDGYKMEGAFEVTKKFLEKYTAKVKAGLAHDDVSGETKVKDDKTLSASLSMKMFPRFIPTLTVNYANYDYRNISRDDDYYSTSLKAIYIITPQIFVGGGLTWTKTDSNDNSFDYTKTVTELSVSYSF